MSSFLYSFCSTLFRSSQFSLCNSDSILTSFLITNSQYLDNFCSCSITNKLWSEHMSLYHLMNSVMFWLIKYSVSIVPNGETNVMYFTYNVAVGGIKVNIVFMLNLVLIKFNALNRFCSKAIILIHCLCSFICIKTCYRN